MTLPTPEMIEAAEAKILSGIARGLSSEEIAKAALTAALSAQQPIKRSVNLTVSDPRNRLVTGLDSDDLIVVEAGVRRPITAFKPAGSPIAIAVVSKRRVDAEVIQASTTADALAQLAAASAPRKALIIADGARAGSIPAGIQVLRVDESVIEKAVLELRHQYVVQFESESPDFDVFVKQPRGLPALRVNRN